MVFPSAAQDHDQSEDESIPRPPRLQRSARYMGLEVGNPEEEEEQLPLPILSPEQLQLIQQFYGLRML